MIENSDAKNARYYNQKLIEKQTFKLLEYYSDPRKQDRKLKGLCKCCYYYLNDRIGGSAITLKKCECCGLELSFGNTCVDKYCVDCAIKERILQTLWTKIRLIKDGEKMKNQENDSFLENLVKLERKKRTYFINKYDKEPKYMKVPLWLYQFIRDLDAFIPFREINEDVVKFEHLILCETITIHTIEEIEIF